MATATPHGNELASWKEIAEYLGVNVRTAQKWETERGLPVHRLPGSGRGHVLVTINELETWKRTGTPGRPEQHAQQPWKLKSLLWAAATMVLAAGIWTIWVLSTAQQVPVSYRLDKNVLMVFDARGRELWRTILPGPASEIDERLFWFGDVDGDGNTEMLFGYNPRDGAGPGVLYCYSHSGAEKWRFVPGRQVRTRVKSFWPSFNISGIAVIQPSAKGPKQVVVSSHHALYYPTQVALLGANGQVAREYWHAGWLASLKVGDIDGDGVPEILLGGIANSYRQAVLVVLDPRHFDGASQEENGDYQLVRFSAPDRTCAHLVPPLMSELAVAAAEHGPGDHVRTGRSVGGCCRRIFSDHHGLGELALR